MSACIITCNAGSSNIKLAMFDAASLREITRAQVQNGEELLAWVKPVINATEELIFGHRVVHGGRMFSAPVAVNADTLAAMESLTPLAPLHQPHNIALIRLLQAAFPHAAHIACFDTAFHASLPEEERRLPLPGRFHEEGVMRYGFHGLSYEYIASALPEVAGNKAHGRVVVAHLGNGSSMCAMAGLKSIATTMGFSTLDGLMMGTRCGALDPGVLLHLQQQMGMPLPEIETLLYRESGLKGISGISHDMRTLQQSTAPEAKEAIALYCRQAARELGKLLPLLGGLDILVFTGGIGEHSAPVRWAIGSYFRWLGMALDEAANAAHAPCISSVESSVEVRVIPANEERVIARACRRLTA